jgi:flagellar motor switch protein FliG
MHETGIRKAAILVASLDRVAAELLLVQLGPERAALVRRAAADIDQIDAEDRQRVIEEFRRIGVMVPSACPSGIELDSLPAQQAGQTFSSVDDQSESEGQAFLSAAAQAGRSTPFVDAPPFAFLREAEEERLSQLLSSERPQTIALVLSHLPPEQAGEVLARFFPPLQVEVVRRLADLDATDTETLREVEQALESRLLRQFAVERGRSAGPAAVARVLAACPQHVVGSILENVAACDAPLAARLGHRPIAFDDLARLDDAVLLDIFRKAEPEVAQAALLGAPPELVERILRRMIPAEAKILRRKLDCPGPIRLSDVEDARQQIAALAQRISLGSPRTPALAA